MEDGVEVEAPGGGAAAGGRGSSEGGYSHVREMDEGATVWAPFVGDLGNFHRGPRPLICDVGSDANPGECATRRATHRANRVLNLKQRCPLLDSWSNLAVGDVHPRTSHCRAGCLPRQIHSGIVAIPQQGIGYKASLLPLLDIFESLSSSLNLCAGVSAPPHVEGFEWRGIAAQSTLSQQSTHCTQSLITRDSERHNANCAVLSAC